MIDLTESIYRLAVVFILAFIIGLERQLRRKPVGFGTFTFVATGACILAILAQDVEEQNPLPLLSGIVTGIGFLGAGALIRHQDRVFGFTTAALIWAMAAMGIATGTGLVELGIAFYLFIWIIVLADRVLELHGLGSHAKIVRLTLANPVTLEEVKGFLPGAASNFELVAVDKERGIIRVTAQVRVKPDKIGEFLAALRLNEKIKEIEFE